MGVQCNGTGTMAVTDKRLMGESNYQPNRVVNLNPFEGYLP